MGRGAGSAGGTSAPSQFLSCKFPLWATSPFRLLGYAGPLSVFKVGALCKFLFLQCFIALGGGWSQTCHLHFKDEQTETQGLARDLAARIRDSDAWIFLIPGRGIPQGISSLITTPTNNMCLWVYLCKRKKLILTLDKDGRADCIGWWGGAVGGGEWGRTTALQQGPVEIVASEQGGGCGWRTTKRKHQGPGILTEDLKASQRHQRRG